MDIMLCPYCGFDESNVLESRDAVDGKATRRRRECLKCHKRFTTYEEVKQIELKVIKRDGTKEDYSRQKMERCLDKACWRNTEEEKAKMVDEIEMKLLNWPTVDIPSQQIGSWIMEMLKEKDALAYIRFATVFLRFEKVADFEKLLKGNKKK